MGETRKGDDATKPSPNQISSSSPKDSSPNPSSSSLFLHHHHQSFLPPPIFIPTVSSPGAPVIPKRPRFSTSTQWKALPSPSGSSPPGQEQPEIETESFQQKFRKGKHVSPVWKPNEMLWLARAWRVQYQNQNQGTEGRGKTRAEKDKEVAEFLNRNGVNRDSKIAGTKWDNMLGEFRKVYEWENGGDSEKFGKSYFRLSPYERKQHRLPASFDEQVYQELALFMGPRVRAPTLGRRSSGGAPVDVTLTPPLPPPPPRDDDVDNNNPITSIGNNLIFLLL